jgi:excisionase family DNA binding protein
VKEKFFDMATPSTIERLGYSVKEAAEAIRVSPGTIRTLIGEGTLSASRIRARVIISREALKKLLEEGKEV